MKLYRCDKIALSIRGNAAQFLNGLSSNTLDQPRNAFLNQHGRIIATFDQARLSGDEYEVVIASFCYEALMEHLNRYARLSKSTIEKKEAAVYFDLEGDGPTAQGDWAIPQKAGCLLITPRALAVNVSDEEFTLFRLRHHIPLHGVDYKDEMILNVDEFDFVCYTKGCFLGQEPVAKVHNRAKSTWKLIVAYADECGPEEKAKMTSVARDPATGRHRGFVFIKNL